MSFRSTFWTVQLAGGFAMAARMFPEGMLDNGGIPGGFLWAAGGFIVMLPIAALIAGIKVAVDRHRERRLVVSSDRPGLRR